MEVSGRSALLWKSHFGAGNVAIANPDTNVQSETSQLHEEMQAELAEQAEVRRLQAEM